MNKNVLIAAAVFAGLLVAVLATRKEEVNQGVPKLVLKPMGDVTAIEVTGAHQAKLKLEGTNWKVDGFAAEDGQVKAVTEQLKDFHAQDFVTEKTEKHAEYEVDDAKGTKVQFQTAAGPGWTLVFGKAAKGGGTYVRDAKSNAVFTTNSPVTHQLERGVSAWRKKGIATAAFADVTKVTVTQPSDTYALVKNGEAWELDPKPGADFRFDAQAAQRVASTATTLQAQEFSTEPLGEQAASLTLETKDGKKVELKLGAKKPDGTTPLQVEGDAQVYLLAQWAVDGLLKKKDDLRDLSLLSFDPEKATKLTLQKDGKTTVALSKDASGWKLVEPKTPPAGFEFDPQLVTSQLQRLKGLRAAHVVAPVADAAAGLAKPVAVVEVQGEGGLKQTIRFGAEAPSKELYVKGSADGLLYSIGAHEKQSFDTGVELFKKRPPPDLSQIRGMEQLPPEVRRQLMQQMQQRNN